MKYTYKTPVDLASIIEELKSGKCETFAIYNGNNGRRLKYDFESGKATLLMQDDNIEQINPNYVGKSVEVEVVPEVVEEVEDTENTEIAETADNKESLDQVYEDSNDADDAESPLNICSSSSEDDAETPSDETEVEVTPESVENEVIDESEVEDTENVTDSPSDEIDKLKAEIALLNSQLDAQKVIINDYETQINKLGDVITGMKESAQSVEFLVDQLAVKGYTVSITRSVQ